MFAKAASYIRKYDLLRAGDRVVAGVSGGADSVCLLHVLVRLRKELGLTIVAVHVHHGLRGEEADRDAAFVEKLAAEWDVPCRMVYANVREYAAENGLSEEEAGRILRYRALREEAQRMNCEGVRIAVGHQKEDQAETILHNLFRGSALKGLAGMAPSAVIDGGICLIRPLLGVSRGEIRSYLAENGLSFCEDSTNDTGDYTRNRIRRLLPQITRDVNAQTVEHILAAGERMAQADAYFEKEAARIWEEYGVAGEAENGAAAELAEGQSGLEAEPLAERCGIPAEILDRQPELLAGYLAMKMIRRMTGSVKDITSVHAEQICGLARMGTGKQISLPYGLRAVREYDMIWVERTAAAGTAPRTGGAAQQTAPRTGGAASQTGGVAQQTAPRTGGTAQQAAPRTGGVLQQTTQQTAGTPAAPVAFSRFPYEKNQKIPENRYTKWFDYDKIKGTLSVRTRQTGDYITIKDGCRKSVKSYMIDEKIPRQERDRILLLAEGSHVLWIIGYRISEYYKVTKETKEILQARARGEWEAAERNAAAGPAGERGQTYGGEEHGREDTGIDFGGGCK